MPAINSRCRQWHKPSFLLLDSFRPVFRQVLKSCTFLFFMLSGLLKPHNHPSLIPFISENQPFPAYSLLSFRECSHMAKKTAMRQTLKLSHDYIYESPYVLEPDFKFFQIDFKAGCDASWKEQPPALAPQAAPAQTLFAPRQTSLQSQILLRKYG